MESSEGGVCDLKIHIERNNLLVVYVYSILHIVTLRTLRLCVEVFLFESYSTTMIHFPCLGGGNPHWVMI